MTTVRHTCGRRSGQSAHALPHGPWPGSVGAILSADTHGASRRCRHQRARPVGPRPALESSWLRTCVFKQRPWGRWHLGHRTGVWGPRVCPQTPGGESGDGSPRLCPWAAPLAPVVLRRPQGRPRSPGPGRPGQLNISAGSQGRPGPPPPCTPSASPAVGSPVALWEQGAPQKGCMPPGQGWGGGPLLLQPTGTATTRAWHSRPWPACQGGRPRPAAARRASGPCSPSPGLLPLALAGTGTAMGVSWSGGHRGPQGWLPHLFLFPIGDTGDKQACV